MNPEPEYTIDDLARAGRTTVRSVRVYHERGLLPPPQVRGRTGYYRPEHLSRLETISQLLSRGMKLSSIKELLDAWDRGEELADVLGVKNQSIRNTDTGSAATAELERVLATGRDAYPILHELAARLLGADVPAAEVLQLLTGLHADCARVAARQAELIRRLTLQARRPALTADGDDWAHETTQADGLCAQASNELIKGAMRHHSNRGYPAVAGEAGQKQS
ncbi:MerR family transcriptional regulator [Nocardia uniformis]|uniref:MerR family transcriptional regulator n=1 Tax=Nocardia uniformis TaxID=53432 RepID=A0A849BS96_9NOCA|nr:MerR family transcriptional regulator [Nocardia uniformis]NNH69502.1 MerR family transcriptional regulator [Nocardia uniformis]